jgi:hypothetical protein
MKVGYEKGGVCEDEAVLHSARLYEIAAQWRVRVPANKLLAVVVSLHSSGCCEVVQSVPASRYLS